MAAESLAEKDYVILAKPQELVEFCERIDAKFQQNEPALSYLDTEADSLHHYQERLCLIQLCIAGELVLIDPFGVENLTPLWRLLDQTELWLHGADYDLSLLKRGFSWTPKRIHDTQIAARLIGHRSFGLAALVTHYCDVTLCKASQKEDWSQRPLPEKMLDYAVDDVRYLPKLVAALKRELEERGRQPWFDQSCDSLRNDVISRQDKNREDSWRISGSGKLPPKSLAFLKELWLWRDGVASEKDVPAFKIVNNQKLLEMVHEFETHQKLEFPPRWRPRWKSEIAMAVKRVIHSEASEWPARPLKTPRRFTEDMKSRLEVLCQSRNHIAEKLDLEPSLLGSKSLLEDLIFEPSQVSLSKLMPWQRELLHEALVPVLQH